MQQKIKTTAISYCCQARSQVGAKGAVVPPKFGLQMLNRWQKLIWPRKANYPIHQAADKCFFANVCGLLRRAVLPRSNSRLRCISPLTEWGIAQLHCYVIIPWANGARSMHFCQIAARYLLAYIYSFLHAVLCFNQGH